jgi:hypothetical protein
MWGTFMLKSEDDALTFFENLFENSLHHSSSGRRTNAKTQTLYEVSQPLDLNAKVDALSKKLDQLLASGFVPATASQTHTHTHHMMHVHFALTLHIRPEIVLLLDNLLLSPLLSR